MYTPHDEIPFLMMDGSQTRLAAHHGKVLLLVNVASRCGLTPQYAGLTRLAEDQAAQGLLVIAFPANDFGAQEPGSNEQIAQFCRTSFGVTFPLAQKIAVTGAQQHALYAALTCAQPEAFDPGQGAMRGKLEGYGHKQAQPSDVLWNFEKFLIGRDGRVVGRFNPDVAPDHPALLAAIDLELAKPLN